MQDRYGYWHDNGEGLRAQVEAEAEQQKRTNEFWRAQHEAERQAEKLAEAERQAAAIEADWLVLEARHVAAWTKAGGTLEEAESAWPSERKKILRQRVNTVLDKKRESGIYDGSL